MHKWLKPQQLLYTFILLHMELINFWSLSRTFSLSSGPSKSPMLSWYSYTFKTVYAITFRQSPTLSLHYFIFLWKHYEKIDYNCVLVFQEIITSNTASQFFSVSVKHYTCETGWEWQAKGFQVKTFQTFGSTSPESDNHISTIQVYKHMHINA